MNDGNSIRRTNVALIVTAVLVPATSGLALLLWADAREYRDNQRNWALMAGWAGVATAGLVGLIGLAAFVRSRGSRRAQLAFAAVLGALSTVLMLAAAFAS